MKENIDFKLRIYDDTVLQLVKGLRGKGKYRTYNDVFNAAIKSGLPALTKQAQKEHYAEEDIFRIVKMLKELLLTVDELFVGAAINERLLATIYNIEAYRAEGETVTKEQFDSGILSALPKEIQEIKNLLEEAHKRDV